MRLSITCMKCLEEFGKPAGELGRVEFCDDGRYEFTCTYGHQTVTVLQQHKFEVLFDIGANAILDGYYREAVSSFTSSLERFFEFCIKVLLESVDVTEEAFIKTWKQVSNQSERQLGAFLFLWVYSMGKAAEVLPNAQVSFRNDVVHKGKIPTKDEALRYGNAVLTVIRPMLIELKHKHQEEINKVIFKLIRDSSKPADKNKHVSTMYVPTIISLSTGESDYDKMSLEGCLNKLSERRHHM